MTYYQNTIASQAGFSRLAHKVDTQVCIVGGGYAGLMTQLGLLQRGIKDVVLLEADTIGAGASGRNGGFVFGGYSLSPKELVTQVGAVKAKQLYQLSLDAVSLIRQRICDLAIDCDLADEGVILANWFSSQAPLFAQQKFMQDNFGVDWEYLSPQSLRQKINSERYSGGLFEANAMHFNPLKYALGIAKENSRLGGEVYENSRALAIRSLDNHIEVSTSSATVNCQHLVVCAGGYIDKLYPKVANAIVPIATYIMVTESLGPNYANSLFTKAAVYDTRFAFDYYRPLIDGRLLWGGRINANTKPPKGLSELLRADLVKVFPHLAKIQIENVWSGLMGYPRHQMPIIGQVDGNIWSNIGFGGHGVGPTTAGGELIASAIAEGDKRYRLFSPWGPLWAGGRLGSLAAQMSYWWYQGRDKLKEQLGQ